MHHDRPDRQGSTPPRGRHVERERRPLGAVVVSALLHVLALTFVGSALVVPRASLVRFFEREPPVEERLAWVEPRGLTGVPEAEPAAGSPPLTRGTPDEPTPEAEPAAPLVAPTVTPSTLPAPASGAAPAGAPDGDARGTGSGGSGDRPGDPTAGLRPTYTDSPIWTRPSEVGRRPLPMADKLDSAIAGDFRRLRDSMVNARETYNPRDWTVARGGQKFGVDSQFIHLGPVKLPTMLLGLLNLQGAQANPIANERARRMEEMRRDILFHADRVQAEKDLDDIISDIRARKDRERAARRGKGGGG